MTDRPQILDCGPGTIPGDVCVARGHPNPDTDPNGWIAGVRKKLAHEVQHLALDLDANRILRVAKARADYEPPAPLSEIRSEILE